MAGVESGADAVYLGGKHFNMRMHEGGFNFDDAMLKKAIDYAHEHGVRLYVTLNNLISNEEIPALREYLAYLNEIRPDALLVQDFAVLELVHEMGITIPLHTSVMMNTHNEHAIEKLKEYGITRIVVGREMTLSELSLFRERTGIEVEYFMHGDMCISESGQCIHSGVLFGQSGNRGRCLKPCRWAYQLIDEKTGEVLDEDGPGAYKLALKDMCMYRAIPQLIQAGVFSFKVRAACARRASSAASSRRTARRLTPTSRTRLYDGRRGLEESLRQPRARLHDDVCLALASRARRTSASSRARAAHFFSHAVKEAGFQDEVLRQERDIEKENKPHRTLSVRVNTVESAKAAIDNDADTICVGGEAFRPLRPWKLGDYAEVLAYAKGKARVVVNTPRTTMRRGAGRARVPLLWRCATSADGLDGQQPPAQQARKASPDLPVQADVSFNLFNQLAAKFLQENGLTMATTSYELSFEQLREIVESAALPLETVVHGSCESMICDHDFPAMSLPEYNELDNPEVLDRHYALSDTAGEKHAIRIDQYGRNHLYFAKDLCLYPYLAKFNGLASYRIEAQDYSPKLTGRVTKLYREALDALAAGKSAEEAFDHEAFEQVQKMSPREWGIGTYRFRQSRNSIGALP